MNELALLALKKLEIRFRNKIDPDLYYLSYSGGRDSEFLRWFMYEYMKDEHIWQIPIVSVNTQREHVEIKDRIYKYADVVLYPTKKMEEIKEQYGMPCFTKFQDEIIGRYQRGSRAWYTMSIVNGTGPGEGKFKLNQTARGLLLKGQLPKVDNKCCKYTKKEPLRLYEKQSGLKPIIAVRGSESVNRSARYKTCLNAKGQFTPMYDITDEMIDAVYAEYGYRELEVYKHLDRTGCIGCPYGRNIEKELSIVTDQQRNYAIASFGEAYKIKGLAV